jgi:hypothetical protein
VARRVEFHWKLGALWSLYWREFAARNAADPQYVGELTGEQRS